MINRINLILQTLNITARQFAEEIGIQPSGMSHILSGRNNPSLDFVLKVLQRYPDIDTDWLLFGKGAMFITMEPHQTTKLSPISSSKDNQTKGGEGTIPEDYNSPNLFSEIEQEINSPTKNLSIMPKEDNPLECEKIDEKMIDISNSEGDLNKDVISMPIHDKSVVNSKKLVKIVLFYDDYSFVEYHQN